MIGTLEKKSTRQNREACETCGTDELYWAKNSESGSWVLIDRNQYTQSIKRGGTVPENYVHAHQPRRSSSDPAPISEPAAEPNTVLSEPSTSEPDPFAPREPWAATTDPIVMPSTAGVAPVAPDETQAALDALRKLLGASNGVDAEELRSIVEGIVGKRLDAYSGEFQTIMEGLLAAVVHPVTTVVVNAASASAGTPIAGTTHNQLADLIGFLEDGHVYLVGPAGTGKSHMAEQAAESRNSTFWSISLTQQTPVSALAGYMDANGNYHRTGFRDAVEFGGVALTDEVDHGHANTVGFMNAATSNSFVGFPDGMVKVHADFRVVAAANTFGQGQTALHTGANKLDAATLNRFGKIEILYDEALENAQVSASGLDSITQAKVLRFVRTVRKNAAKHPEFQVVASPRNSVRIARALARGVDWEKAIEVHLLAGISDEKRAKLI